MKKYCVIAGICAAALLCIGAIQQHEDSKYTLTEVAYTVRNGDSLYSIAAKHMAKQDREDDIRNVAAKIDMRNREVINQYRTLRAGQVLVIPLEVRK